MTRPTSMKLLALCVAIAAAGCNLSAAPLNNTAGSNNSDSNNTACEPETDAQLCDAVSDDCSVFVGVDRCGKARNVVCDKCPTGALCDPEAETCTQCANVDFCTLTGAECGEITSASNPGMQECDTQSVGCGTCEAGFTCTNNTCVAQDCTREDDALLCGLHKKQCGTHTLTDMCGGSAEADCGTCAEGSCEPDGTCSVCQPEIDTVFCARVGAACGSATGTDNCQDPRTVDECGPCAQGLRCVDNMCACVPKTPAQLKTAACGAKMCGEVMADDGCGAMVEVSCGTCPAPQTCFQDQCCQPVDLTNYCATQGFMCGEHIVDDGCGGTVTAQCGACSDYGTCVSGSCTEITRTSTEPHFGRSVAVEGGNIVVGAARNANSGNQPGSIHLYQTVNSWNAPLVQDALWPYMGSFGWTVGIYNDAIVVGIPATGKVVGYSFTPTAITQKAIAPSANSSLYNYGFDVSAGLGPGAAGHAIGTEPTNGFNSTNNGTRINVGGIVTYMLTGNWTKSGESFISRKPAYDVNQTFVGITADVKARVRAFGVPTFNEVIIDKVAGSTWQQSTILTRPEPGFGIRVDLSPNGKFLAVTQRNTVIDANTQWLEDYPALANHKVFILENTSGDTWLKVAEFEDTANTTSQFGYDVAMGNEDLFVGMPGAGAFRHYKRNGSTWALQGTKAVGGNFGYALDFDGRILAVTRHTPSGGTLHIYDFQ